MKRLVVFTFVMILVFSGVSAQQSVGGWDPDELEKAEETVKAARDKDKGLDKFFKKAYGYAVFATVAKGAVGIGGARGKGIVFEAGKPVGKSTLTQVTVGFQLGGQAYSEIIFFENKDAIDRFKGGNFELAAQASAVAVTIGASADLAYNNGVAIVTMTKGGLMYEASIGGQKFSYNDFEEKTDE